MTEEETETARSRYLSKRDANLLAEVREARVEYENKLGEFIAGVRGADISSSDALCRLNALRDQLELKA